MFETRPVRVYCRPVLSAFLSGQTRRFIGHCQTLFDMLTTDDVSPLPSRSAGGCGPMSVTERRPHSNSPNRPKLVPVKSSFGYDPNNRPLFLPTPSPVRVSSPPPYATSPPPDRVVITIFSIGSTPVTRPPRSVRSAGHAVHPVFAARDDEGRAGHAVVCTRPPFAYFRPFLLPSSQVPAPSRRFSTRITAMPRRRVIPSGRG